MTNCNLSFKDPNYIMEKGKMQALALENSRSSKLIKFKLEVFNFFASLILFFLLSNPNFEMDQTFKKTFSKRLEIKETNDSSYNQRIII